MMSTQKIFVSFLLLFVCFEPIGKVSNIPDLDDDMIRGQTISKIRNVDATISAERPNGYSTTTVNGSGENGATANTSSSYVDGLNGLGGGNLTNGTSVDDNTTVTTTTDEINFNSTASAAAVEEKIDDDDVESSSVVIEMLATENNSIADNEIETVSYDANTNVMLNETCCNACRPSCSSSLSNHSQAADFLDIDIVDVEEDENNECFENNNNNNNDENFLPETTSSSIENNLSQVINRNFSPLPPAENVVAPAAAEAEDEGVICQENNAPVVVVNCTTDCEACNRADSQIVGLLAARVETDPVGSSGASSSSYRRKGSQYFSVGGPRGRQLAEETFLRCVSPCNKPSCSSDDESFFIMSVDEAARQVAQLGPSSCGATAISNVLNALKWTKVNLDDVSYVVGTRLRAVGAPLAEYLLSRSVAGVSHLDLITAVEKLTWQQINGRFFHMYPRRNVNISQWLLKWLKKGAVPVLTANMQRGTVRGRPVADAWHHQMVFAADRDSVYVCNPVENIGECVLQEILCSSSVLLVRAEDVHQHWTKGCDLSSLLNNSDSRWTEMNVIGQIIGVIREHSVPRNRGEPTVTHVAIPACYLSGVTLFAPANSSVWTEIVEAKDLPHLFAYGLDDVFATTNCPTNSTEPSSSVQIFMNPS